MTATTDSVAVPEPPRRGFLAALRLWLVWWRQELRQRDRMQSKPSTALVGGGILVALPVGDMPNERRLAVEALRRMETRRWAGRARLRRRRPLPELSGRLVVRTRVGWEDLALRRLGRLHEWLINPERASGGDWIAEFLQHPPMEDHRVLRLGADRIPIVDGAADPSSAPPAVGGPRLPRRGIGQHVVVVDTAPDLAQLEAAGYDVSGVEVTHAPTSDDRGWMLFRPRPRPGGHGTCVVAAVLETAPAATITVVPALPPQASTSAELLVEGIVAAAMRPTVDVVNLSVALREEPDGRGGAFWRLTGVRSALDGLAGRGAVVVAAAGNASPADVGLAVPASDPAVLAIGAVYADEAGRWQATPDSRYDPAHADIDLWVEVGGHLEGGEVRVPGIVVGTASAAGSSVATARAAGRIAAFRATPLARLLDAVPDRATMDVALAARLLRLETPDGAALVRTALARVSAEGLHGLPPARRGRGWARPEVEDEVPVTIDVLDDEVWIGDISLRLNRSPEGAVSESS